jgi:hypothetical protein
MKVDLILKSIISLIMKKLRLQDENTFCLEIREAIPKFNERSVHEPDFIHKLILQETGPTHFHSLLLRFM